MVGLKTNFKIFLKDMFVQVLSGTRFDMANLKLKPSLFTPRPNQHQIVFKI